MIVTSPFPVSSSFLLPILLLSMTLVDTTWGQQYSPGEARGGEEGERGFRSDEGEGEVISNTGTPLPVSQASQKESRPLEAISHFRHGKKSFVGGQKTYLSQSASRKPLQIVPPVLGQPETEDFQKRLPPRWHKTNPLDSVSGSTIKDVVHQPPTDPSPQESPSGDPHMEPSRSIRQTSFPLLKQHQKFGSPRPSAYLGNSQPLKGNQQPYSLPSHQRPLPSQNQETSREQDPLSPSSELPRPPFQRGSVEILSKYQDPLPRPSKISHLTFQRGPLENPSNYHDPLPRPTDLLRPPFQHGSVESLSKYQDPLPRPSKISHLTFQRGPLENPSNYHDPLPRPTDLSRPPSQHDPVEDLSDYQNSALQLLSSSPPSDSLPESSRYQDSVRRLLQYLYSSPKNYLLLEPSRHQGSIALQTNLQLPQGEFLPDSPKYWDSVLRLPQLLLPAHLNDPLPESSRYQGSVPLQADLQPPPQIEFVSNLKNPSLETSMDLLLDPSVVAETEPPPTPQPQGETPPHFTPTPEEEISTSSLPEGDSSEKDEDLSEKDLVTTASTESSIACHKDMDPPPLDENASPSTADREDNACIVIKYQILYSMGKKVSKSSLSDGSPKLAKPRIFVEKCRFSEL